MDMKSSKPFGERVDALRELLDLSHPDLDAMCGMAASKVRIRFKCVFIMVSSRALTLMNRILCFLLRRVDGAVESKFWAVQAGTELLSDLLLHESSTVTLFKQLAHECERRTSKI